LCLEALAWIAASCGQPTRAVDLLGAATAAWNSIPTSLPTPLARYRQAAAGRARNALGEASFTAHLNRAQAMAPSQAVAMALDEPATAVKPAPARSDPARLTAREREVAALIAQGLSNRDIAERLVISARTAETHVQHIMVKLGLTARAQIAAWTAAETGRHP
jgi:non-specific serine/threonine protein kinase